MKKILIFTIFLLILSTGVYAIPNMVFPHGDNANRQISVSDYVSMTNRYTELQVQQTSGWTCYFGSGTSNPCSVYTAGWWTIHNKNDITPFMRLYYNGNLKYTLAISDRINNIIYYQTHGHTGSNLIANIRYQIFSGEWNFVTGFFDREVGYWAEPSWTSLGFPQHSNVGRTSAQIQATLNLGYKDVDWHISGSGNGFALHDGNDWSFHFVSPPSSHNSGQSTILSKTITGLQPLTTYSYKTFIMWEWLGSLKATEYPTSGLPTFTTSATTPTATIRTPTNVGKTSATLRTFYNMGDWERIGIRFRLERWTGSSWVIAGTESYVDRFSGTTYETGWGGLLENTLYRYRSEVGYNSNLLSGSSYNAQVNSGWQQFTTLASASMTTQTPDQITSNSARLRLSLNLGGDSSASTYWRYCPRSGSTNNCASGHTWTSTSPQTRSSGGTYTQIVGSLLSNTNYVVQGFLNGVGQNYAYFTTNAKIPPTLTRRAIEDLSFYSVTLSGEINWQEYSQGSMQGIWIEVTKNSDTTWANSDLYVGYLDGNIVRTIADIDSLDPNTLYKWRVRLTYNSDSGVSTIFSDVGTFTTFDDIPVIQTLSVQTKTHNTANLRGELTTLGSETNIVLYFEYEEFGSGNTQTTSTIIRSNTGEFTIQATSLLSDTTYEYRLVGEYGLSETIYGGYLSFTTNPDEPQEVGVFANQILQFNDEKTLNVGDYFSNYNYIKVRLYNQDLATYEELRTDVGGVLINSYFDAELVGNILTIYSKNKVYSNSMQLVAVKDTEVTRSANLEIQEPPLTYTFVGETINIELPQNSGGVTEYNLTATLQTNYFDRVNDNSLSCSVFNGVETRTPYASCSHINSSGNRVYSCPFEFFYEDNSSLDWYYTCDITIDSQLVSFGDNVELSIYNFGTIPTPPQGGGGSGGTTIIIEGDMRFDIDEFYITPTIQDVFVSRGEKRLVEFRVVNTYVTPLNFTAHIQSESVGYSWMSFHETMEMKTTAFAISKEGGIGSDSRFIRYYIEIPDNVEDGVYEGEILVATGETAISYKVNINVGTNPIREFLSRNLIVMNGFRLTYGFTILIFIVIIGIISIIIGGTTSVSKKK